MATIWDSTHKHSSVTLSNGSLTAACANPGFTADVRATVGPTTGKKYWEIHVDSWDSSNAPAIGVVATAEGTGTAPGYDADDVGYVNLLSGAIIRNSSSISTVGAMSVGDVIAIALDADARTIAFYKNNTLLYTATGTNVPSGALFPAVGTTGNGAVQYTANFGATAFTYTPPSGFTGFDTAPTTITGDISIDAEVSSLTGHYMIVTGDVSVDAEVSSPYSHKVVVTGDVTAAVEVESPLLFTDNYGAPILPRLQASAHGYVGIIGKAAAAVLPLPTSQGLGSALPNEALLAPIAASGTGLTGIIGTADAALPAFVSDGTVEVPGQGEGVAAYPAFRASGTGYTTIAGTAAAALRRMLSSGDGHTGAAALLAQPSLAAIAASGTGFSQITGTAAAALPLFMVDARAVLGELAVSRIVAMMAASSACTEYAGWDFNSFAVYRGAVLAAGASGVVSLAGSDDAGTAIDASFETGEVDHGTDQLKRPTDVYAGIKTDGVMTVNVTGKVDKIAETYSYELAQGEDEDEARKADVGRGFKARYLKYGMSNNEGCGFTIDAMTALAQPTGRRA